MTDSANCHCGLVVFAPADLDEVGLCVVCAGSGHDWSCACLECAVYVQELEAGALPAAALERAIGAVRSAAKTA